MWRNSLAGLLLPTSIGCNISAQSGGTKMLLAFSNDSTQLVLKITKGRLLGVSKLPLFLKNDIADIFHHCIVVVCCCNAPFWWKWDASLLFVYKLSRKKISCSSYLPLVVNTSNLRLGLNLDKSICSCNSTWDWSHHLQKYEKPLLKADVQLF